VLPESMLWLLLTGQVPSEVQVRQLSRELAEQGELPDYIATLIDSYVDLEYRVRFVPALTTISVGCQKRYIP
jgi:citrate synthase